MISTALKKAFVSCIIAITLAIYLPTLIPSKIPHSSPIIHETLFIDILTELKLLYSWLPTQSYPPEILHTIWYHNFQEILAYHAVDQPIFEASVKFYLENSVDQAISIYSKLDESLKQLLTNILYLPG